MSKLLTLTLITIWLSACALSPEAMSPTAAARKHLTRQAADSVRILDSYRAPDGKYLVVYTSEQQLDTGENFIDFGGITLARRLPFGWQAINQQNFITNDSLPNELIVTGSYTEPGWYTVLYGQVLSDEVTTIEAVLDDGSILRDADGGESFAFFPTGSSYVNELRLLDAQGDLLQVFNPGALEQAAGDALSTYFESLFTGNYARAAELYGGGYTALADMNPKVDPQDHAALLEQACTVNGFVCLRLASYGVSAHPSPGEFTFLVEFEDEHGNPYERMPCCTTPLPGEVARSEFGYRVVKGEDGQFRVMELPLMEP